MELLVFAKVLSIALMYASDGNCCRHAQSLKETQKWLGDIRL